MGNPVGFKSSRLTLEEYADRRDKTTDEQIQLLCKSKAFKEWKDWKERCQAKPHLWPWMILILVVLLSTVALVAFVPSTQISMVHKAQYDKALQGAVPESLYAHKMSEVVRPIDITDVQSSLQPKTHERNELVDLHHEEEQPLIDEWTQPTEPEIQELLAPTEESAEPGQPASVDFDVQTIHGKPEALLAERNTEASAVETVPKNHLSISSGLAALVTIVVGLVGTMLKEKKISGLQQKLTESKAKQKSLEERSQQGLDKIKADFAKEIQVLRNKLAEADSKLTDAEYTISHLKDEQIQQLTQATDDVNKLRAEQVTELEAQKTIYAEKASVAESQMAELQSKLVDAEKKLQAKSISAEAQFEELQSQISEQSRSFDLQLHQAQKEVESFKAESQRSSEKAASLEAQVSAANNKATEVEAQLKDSRMQALEEQSLLKLEIIELQQKLKDTESKACSDAFEHKEKVAGIIQMFLTRNRALTSELTEARQKLKQIEQKFDQSRWSET